MFRHIRIIVATAVCTMTTLSLANPVTSLLERIDRGASKRISIEIASDGTNNDYFELSQRNGKPHIKGNNYISVATGINWYLKYYCHIHLSWNNITQTEYRQGYAPLPVKLPSIQATERHSTSLKQRYALNYCTFSYSMAFWDWKRWQQEIDLMALHGINMPLAIVGLDVVWRNVLRHYGYSNDEINAFIAGPAFQAWWAMANLEGWGGPNSDAWYDARAKLQKQLLRRMRELGMEPVLPGYLGMVPHNAKDKLALNVDDAGLWNGFPRPANLSPKDKRFAEIAQVYYDELTKLCGKSRYYSMDPFHEGGSDDKTDFAGAAQAIYKAMKACNKDAVWVIQGWGQNPREAVMNTMKKGDILILDLYSTAEPHWIGTGTTSAQKANAPTNEELSLGENANDVGFKGHDWLFCMLDNFGGRVGMNGHLTLALDGFKRAQQLEKNNLRGIGFTMEAIENNPLCFELMSELPWRDSVDLNTWVEQYCHARYNTSNDSIVKAWQLLARTVLDCPYPMHGPQESLFCARPSKSVHQASETGRTRPYYDPEVSQRAEQLLHSAADDIADGTTYSIARNNYEYDFVDVSRQARADKGRIVYNQAMADYRSFDRKAFEKHSQTFLSLILQQDSLLATRPEFTIERWTNMARQLASTQEEADKMEWNARVQITTWGIRATADDGHLHEYANKEWSGLLRTLYYNRWRCFFDMLKASLNGKDEEIIDFYPMEEEWTKMKTNGE